MSVATAAAVARPATAAASTGEAEAEGDDAGEQRVTSLELFFDLVFVFALTQVTGFLAAHLSWTGMLQGAAILATLWWAVRPTRG
jgi:low temperature requirement protein LtrA